MSGKKKPTVTISVKPTDGKAPKPLQVEIPQGGKVLTEVLDSQGVSVKKVNVYVDGKQVKIDDLKDTTVKPGAKVSVEQRASGS